MGEGARKYPRCRGKERNEKDGRWEDGENLETMGRK
jgi:hypothetical protein